MKFSGWRWKKGRRLSKVFPFEYFKRYFKHFTTKRNHWTVSLNCLIKFSVAAKLKICFLYFFVEKNLMFLFYPSFMSANRWYLAHFTRLFQAFPLAILLSSSRLPFQSEWKTKGFCSADMKVFPIYVGSTSSNYWFSTSVKLSSESCRKIVPDVRSKWVAGGNVSTF